LFWHIGEAKIRVTTQKKIMENTISVVVEGMTCGNCALTISKVLEKKGMTHIAANAASGEVSFTTPEHTDVAQVFDIIDGLGYKVQRHKPEEETHQQHDHAHAPTEAQLKDWKEEYLPIAERRVRLGLVLAELANQNKVDVTQKEIADAILQQARNYPGQEKQVIEYFKTDENARASLRGPLLEEKVIDFIINHLPLTVIEVSYQQMNEMIRARREDDNEPSGKSKAKKTSKK
jgi:copper chaperone CopZ